MQLRIHVSGQELPPASRRNIERSTRLAMGRHASGVEVARLHLSRRAVETGGDAAWCEVRARLRGGDVVLVEERADDVHAAAAFAAARLARILGRRREAVACGFAEPGSIRRR